MKREGRDSERRRNGETGGWRGIDGKEGREKERGERLNKKGWRRTEDTRN